MACSLSNSERTDEEKAKYALPDSPEGMYQVEPLSSPEDLMEQRAAAGSEPASCGALVLCRHAYIGELDEPGHDRESRDLQRIACLNSADIVVTEAPDAVRLLHRSGGWVEHDGMSITMVEVLLAQAYGNIETQIFHGPGAHVRRPPCRHSRARVYPRPRRGCRYVRSRLARCPAPTHGSGALRVWQGCPQR